MRPRRPDPRCVGCNTLAADMEYLDGFWAETQEEIDALDEAGRQEERVAYARTDGTYNRDNGNFWCDVCYIEVGMPLGVAP